MTEFLIYFIFLVIKFLVKIGDLVIFLTKFLANFIRLIALNFYLFIQSLGLRLLTIVQKIQNISINIEVYSLNTLNNKKNKLLLVFKKIIKKIQKYPKKIILKIKNSQKANLKPHTKVNHAVIFHSHKKLSKFKYFIAGSMFSFIFFFLPLLFLIFIQELPNPKVMTLQNIPQTTKIYDRNGKLLYQIYASENRTLVPLKEIPNSLKQATIAIEDKDFYKHPGFDIQAIIRSFKENISGNSFQGGSTLTQQLIKSALLTPEVSIQRKIKEVILAFWAERLYTKDQILEMYFNQIPYGGTAWGTEAASSVYFGKDVKDLTLAESAFLAGIPKAPTIYSPFGTNKDAWKKRQKEVLKRMVALEFISQKEAEDAEKEELHFKEVQVPIHAPHFVMYVKDLLVKKYGIAMVEKGGLTVTTSLDLDLQEKTQKIVTSEVDNNAYLNLSNGASLIINPTNGDILAMVGSHDYSDPNDGNVNLTTALRQPGSSIKVVTYSAALQSGFTSATILDDSPVTYTFPGAPSYTPVNYDGKFHGKIPLRIALANSFNIPAVKLLNQIGVLNMINLGKKMGISTWNEPERYGLSITLGSAEVNMVDLSTVYGVLANKGYRVDPNPFLKVVDQKGEVLEEKNTNQLDFFSKKHVLDEGITFIISDILADNSARAFEFGSNSPLLIPNHRVSVKTGTSDNKRDNWTVGYTTSNTEDSPSYVVATWVGNNDNSPMSQNLASGITGAAPIFNRIMSMLLANTQDSPLVIPSNVIKKNCIGKQEYFIKGTENLVNCNWNPSPTISPTKKP